MLYLILNIGIKEKRGIPPSNNTRKLETISDHIKYYNMLHIIIL